MNKITILAATACLSLAMNPLYADDAHHPEKAQGSSGAKAPATAGAATPSKPAGDKVRLAQQTMKKLQDKMAQIRTTKDPGVRQKLMHEHMQTMQEGMMQMRGMSGGMMMGGDMMTMRMDMMQMMLEQMMQREEMREGMPGK